MITTHELTARLSTVFEDLSADLRAQGNDTPLFAKPLYWQQYRTAHELVQSLGAGDLLDWGAGIGHFAYVQSRLGSNVTAYAVDDTGISPYSIALRQVAQRSAFEAVFGNHPTDLPFPDNTFDTAVSCGVLEHVREFGGDDQGSLDELFRVLRPGGAFVCLHLPNHWSASEILRRKLGKTHHAFVYRPADFVRMANHSGFQVERAWNYGVLPWNSLAAKLPTGFASTAIATDQLLAKPFGKLAQNLGFVCRKPS